MTSAEAELPYDYYSMPFCRPEDGVQKAAQSVNPGTILMGLRIENSPYTFFMMIDEKTKLVCRAEGQKGSYGKLSKDEATEIQEKIRDAYNVRLILDNLPVTTYDLQRGPESVRPGFELGFVADNKYYINNHLIFKILVHPTNGQYTRMKEEMEQLEAAAVVEVVCVLVCVSYTAAVCFLSWGAFTDMAPIIRALVASCWFLQSTCMPCASCCRTMRRLPASRQQHFSMRQTCRQTGSALAICLWSWALRSWLAVSIAHRDPILRRNRVLQKATTCSHR